MRIELWCRCGAAIMASMSISAVAGDLYVSPGGISYHADRRAGYNESNHGVQATWKRDETWALAAGSYANSLHARSYFAAVRATPVSAGFLRFGALAGLVTGYDANGGRAIPVFLPAMVAEAGPVEVTMLAWPSVYGSGAGLAVNFSFKVW